VRRACRPPSWTASRSGRRTRSCARIPAARSRTSSARDHASALALLERALDERSPGVVRAVRDPAFEPLHGEARFRRVMARLGLS
jgi:hypothetical protein